jgi:hypothetical protein
LAQEELMTRPLALLGAALFLFVGLLGREAAAKPVSLRSGEASLTYDPDKAEVIDGKFGEQLLVPARTSWVEGGNTVFEIEHSAGGRSTVKTARRRVNANVNVLWFISVCRGEDYTVTLIDLDTLESRNSNVIDVKSPMATMVKAICKKLKRLP